MITHEQKKLNDRTLGRGLLIILTLKKHVDGIWITKLVERLKESVPPSSSFRHIEIRTRALEDWLAEGWLISDKVESDNNHGIIGIINRVSDAASPALFKACCAVLASAEQSLKIPVWNGSTAYSLCGNKWRHHLLFRQAKLLAPTTMVYYTGHGGGGGYSGIDQNLWDRRQVLDEKTINIDTQIFRRNESGRIEVLVKPNAGGFGAGIRKISLPSPMPSSSDSKHPSSTRETTKISIPSSFEDDMALVQQYETPRDGKIYRVWFLNGKVQCAVKRKVNGGEETEDDNIGISSSAEFTSGCAGGNSCKRSGPNHQNDSIASSSNNQTPLDNHPSMASPLSKTPRYRGLTTNPSYILPWEVPAEVRQEIEDQLLPLLVDAHCGSVEFLYASSTLPKITSTVPSCSSSKRDNEDVREKSKNESSNESTIRPRDCLRRLYFDLNLLSTLPIIDATDSIHDEGAGETIWPKSYDPWLELAHGIWKFCTSSDEKRTTERIINMKEETVE